MAERKTKPDILRDYAIRVKETGEIFFNAWELAEIKGYSIKKIRSTLKNPKLRYKGYSFELLDPIEAGFDH